MNKQPAIPVLIPTNTDVVDSSQQPPDSAAARVASWLSSGRAKALILALISTLSYSLHALFVKKVNSISSYELVAMSGGLSLIPCIIMLLALRTNPFKFGPLWHVDVIMLVVRGILGLFVDVLRVVALHFLPIGDGTTILFSNPVVVAAAAPFVLKEKLRPSTIVAVLLTIAGIVLVSRPTILFDPKGFFGHTETDESTTVLGARGFGITTALAATFLSGCVLIMLRMMRHINEHTVVLWAAFINLVGGILLTIIIDGSLKMPADDEMLDVFLACLFLYGSNLFVTLAFQFDSAARVASLRSTVVVWSFIWQVVVFDDPISWLAITGALLVMLSVAIVGWAKGDDDVPNGKIVPTSIKRQAYDEVEGANIATSAPPMVLAPTITKMQATSSANPGEP